jgi:hypothetical protein
MPDREHDLISMIARFREGVAELLADNDRFHSALNGDDPIKFTGLGIAPAKYAIEAHEALVWRDPEAYMDEFTRWKGASEFEVHQAAIEHVRRTHQETVFRGLVQAVRRGRVCPFVGAGTSAALRPPHNFPNWKSALTEIAVRIETGAAADVAAKCADARLKIQGGDLIAAGALLYDASKVQVDNYVATTYSVSADITLGEISGPVLLLPQLTDGCVITTNFDNLIERVFLHAGRSFEGYMHGSQAHNKFATSLTHGERCILKLHGDAADADTYVFSTQQYDAAYGSPVEFSKPLSRSLRQIYVSHTLLFIGCSLEADRTMGVFESVASSKEFDLPQHYAIVEDPGDAALRQNKENRLLLFRISPIWFPTGEYTMPEQIISASIAAAQRRITV